MRFVFPVVGRDGRPIALKASLLGPDAVTAWIHLAYEGTWEGHPAGTFEFTRAFFDRLVSRFYEQSNPAPLTYEHPDYRGMTPAAGWIQNVEVRDGKRGAELWAEVEFTKRAAEFVRNGEYRFCSIVFDQNATDRRTGEPVGPELYEVGLTNQPFIDGQQPIMFSRGNHMNLSKIAAELETRGYKLANGKSLKQLVMEAFKELGDEDPPMDKLLEFLRAKEAVERIKSGGEANGGEAEMADDKPAEMARAELGYGDKEMMAEDAPDAPAEPAGAEDFMTRVIEMLGVTSADEALALIDAMLAGGGEEPEPAMMSKTLQNQVTALTRRIADLESERDALRDEKLRDEVLAVVDRLPQVHAEKSETVAHYVQLAKQWPDGWAAQRAAAEKSGPQPPRRQLGRAPVSTSRTVEDVQEHPLFAKLSKAYGFIKDPEERKNKIAKAIAAAEGN